MTTPNSTTERGVTDSEVDAALQGMRFTATGIPKREDMRRALEAFAQSRQPSAQGGERVEPPIERVMGEACTNCHGSGIGMDGKPCPFAPHKQVTYKLRAPPPAGGGKEALSDAERMDFVLSALVADEAKIIDILHDEEGFPLSRERMLENIDAAIRAGKKG